MVEERGNPKTETNDSTSQSSDAKLVDWLELPITKGKKVAVVQTTNNGKKEAVTLKHLYELVVKENERQGTKRGGREKQVLSEVEEQKLELQRMGGGIIDIGGINNGLSHLVRRIRNKQNRGDVVYGIYCSPGRAHEILGKRWKGIDPEEVISSGRFQYDILKKCHMLDMHAMLVMMEPIPLSAIQPRMQKELETRVEKLSVDKDAMRDDIETFVRVFDEHRVKDCDWMEGGAIKRGTQVILSSTPKAGLVVEAITPGPLGRRKTTIIGMNKNPILTASVFDCFLGHEAIDREGGLRCLDGLVWCANGLSTDTRTNSHSTVSEIDVDGTELFGPHTELETIPLSKANIFRMEKTHKPKNLLLQFMKM